MKQIGELFNRSLELTFTRQVEYKDERDEIVSRFTEEINKGRIGTQWKPTNKRTIALMLKLNPFYSKDNMACWDLYNHCMKVGNFSKFWLDCKGKKNI